eukprot:1510027-Pyramimonas_sp.AAC.1
MDWASSAAPVGKAQAFESEQVRVRGRTSEAAGAQVPDSTRRGTCSASSSGTSSSGGLTSSKAPCSSAPCSSELELPRGAASAHCQ